MVDFVGQAAAGANRIADLYSGVGTFTFRLSEIAPTHAVDFGPGAVAALSAALASAPGLKGVTVEARDLVRRPLLVHDLRHTDVVVFDPPRAGAAEQVVEIANSKVSRVIGVSCNPATFARDARVLIDGGFTPGAHPSGGPVPLVAAHRAGRRVQPLAVTSDVAGQAGRRREGSRRRSERPART